MKIKNHGHELASEKSRSGTRRFARNPGLVLLLLFFWPGEVHAVPPVQHRTHGVVVAIDLETQSVVIAPDAKTMPETFYVEEPGTRLRRDGQAATLRSLPIGQPVRIYFRREPAKSVATEIGWRSAEAPGPKS